MFNWSKAEMRAVKDIDRQVEAIRLNPAVNSTLKQIDEMARARDALIAKAPYGYGACACIGPMRGDPVCPCDMERLVRYRGKLYTARYDGRVGRSLLMPVERTGPSQVPLAVIEDEASGAWTLR